MDKEEIHGIDQEDYLDQFTMPCLECHKGKDGFGRKCVICEGSGKLAV